MRIGTLRGAARLFLVFVLICTFSSRPWASPVVATEAGETTIDCNRSVPVGWAKCFAHVKTVVSQPLASVQPSGFGPAQFRSAYSLPSISPDPITIAVVVAYHDSRLSSDLKTYSASMGISPPPSLIQLNQRGKPSTGSSNLGWSLEESMDVETVHGICPNCPLVVVEADSPSMANLLAAEDMAAAQGAKVISNSYGGDETTDESRSDAQLQHRGVVEVFSSGDNGYGVSYPAASPGVVAVGGTSLRLTGSGRRSSETVWSGSGSGCSELEDKPVWQKDSACLRRTVVDVSADADPATGAAVYDSKGYQGQKGWFVLGGTSLSAPLIAGIYGLTGGGAVPGDLYRHPSYFYDVSTGSTASCGSYLCRGAKGYDGPSGLGAPSGLKAF
jgi:hypothetical protein